MPNNRHAKVKIELTIDRKHPFSPSSGLAHLTASNHISENDVQRSYQEQPEVSGIISFIVFLKRFYAEVVEIMIMANCIGEERHLPELGPAVLRARK